MIPHLQDPSWHRLAQWRWVKFSWSVVQLQIWGARDEGSRRWLLRRRTTFLQGERAAWERMAAIHVSYGVEIAIDECLAKLTKTSKVEQSVGDMEKAMALQPPSLNKDQTPGWSNHSYYLKCSSLQVQQCTAILQIQQGPVSKHQW